MKRCQLIRRQITWMATGDLALGEIAEVQAHLITCPECAVYSKEVSELTHTLRKAAPCSDISPEDVESLHERLRSSLTRASLHENQLGLGNYGNYVMRWLRLHSAVAGGLAIAVAVTVTAWFLWWHTKTPSTPSQAIRATEDPAVPLRSISEERATSRLAAYRNAANQSWETLDHLLTTQASRGFSGRALTVGDSAQMLEN